MTPEQQKHLEQENARLLRVIQRLRIRVGNELVDEAFGHEHFVQQLGAEESEWAAKGDHIMAGILANARLLRSQNTRGQTCGASAPEQKDGR